MYNKIIGIIYGGYSSENQISKLSCNNIFNVLKDNYKNLFKVEISHDRWVVYDKNNVSYFINKKEFSFVINSKLKKFDLVINMIHGSPGEDGEFAKYLNKLNIHNNSLAPDIARLTQDKFNCNKKAKSIGINTPNNIKLENKNDLKLIYDKIKFPCFVKPNSGGSSIGVSKVNELNDLENAVNIAFKEDEIILIEEFIEGREFSVGAIEWKNKLKILPITEIKTKNIFFDFEAKYNGKSEEITPAEISNKLRNQLKSNILKIYKEFNLKGIVRCEFIVKNNKAYLLDINNIPGMTKESIIIKQLKIAKIPLKNYYDSVIHKHLK